MPLRDVRVDDMASIHGDRVSLPGRFFVERLKDLAPNDEGPARALEFLRSWNGTMDTESVGATIYTVTRDQLTGLLMSQPKLLALNTNPFTDEPRLPAVKPEALIMWTILPTLLGKDDTTLLAEGQDWESLLIEALGRAVEWLKGKLGPNMEEWRWGRLHRTLPVHPLAAVSSELGELLNPPPVSIGGDGDTPQAARISPGVSYNVVHASVARYVFDLADWDNSRWVVPLGSSGHPGSRHYADQAGLWADVELVPMLYSWERIIADAETEQRLEPSRKKI
jgi:penicillin amidase